jgi:hypothetical protein
MKNKKPDQVADHPNIMPYPTNVGAPKFEPLPIATIKDKAKNIARYHANEKLEELNEQYQLVLKQAELIQNQAQKIIDRLSVTDKVLESEYQFVTVPYKIYYVVWDKRKEFYRLVSLGPNDWSTGAPTDYVYEHAVRLLGDGTWEIVSEE